MEGHPNADLFGGAADRFAIHPERTYLATSQEHHVPTLHLEQVGSGEAAGEVDGRGLEHNVRGPDMQGRVRRGHLAPQPPPPPTTALPPCRADRPPPPCH